ncbi:MAG: hypothetical protein JWM85_672 [Acidimicrobiaceae bacterium]|nr:hypothetical protein [Acidimicrobiaceae bacterium]
MPTAFHAGYEGRSFRATDVNVSRSEQRKGPDQQIDDERFLVLDSCHSTWLFDQVLQCFARVLKAGGAHSSVATAWRQYDHLLVDSSSDAFLVFLDSSGTRVIRSWRHTARCEQCGGEPTAELPVAELRRALNANAVLR